MEDADERADTIRLLRKMTKTERELVYLRYACLMSERAVSDAMGISRRRYRYHERRAILVVRESSRAV